MRLQSLTQNTAVGVRAISRVQPVGAQIGGDHLLNQRLKLEVLLSHPARLMDPLEEGRAQNHTVV